MLESANDYISILVAVAAGLLALAFCLYFVNLSVVEKNVREEIEYYNYDKNELSRRKEK